jgi:hypothetical protein
LRTPAEGLQPEMTKPNRKKNRMNTGGFANVLAGISNSRIVLWEYLPKRWREEMRQLSADLSHAKATASDPALGAGAVRCRSGS